LSGNRNSGLDTFATPVRNFQDFELLTWACCLKTSGYCLVYSTTRPKAVHRELNHLWEFFLMEKANF